MKCFEATFDGVSGLVSPLRTNNVVAIHEKVAKQHSIVSGSCEVLAKFETKFHGNADKLLSTFIDCKVLAILPTMKESEECLALWSSRQQKIIELALDLYVSTFWKQVTVLQFV